MILFVAIAAFVFFYSIFGDRELLYEIRASLRGIHPVVDIFKNIWGWIWVNVLFNILNIVAVYCISAVVFFGLCFVCPKESSQWEFNINALEDHLVTEGEFRGRYASRGHVDGELSYFYSRTLYRGEKIEHIPANKTYVKYSSSEHPHVEVHQSRFDIPEWLTKLLFIDWMNGKHIDYYILVVPEGTIENTGQYSIDMG